MVDASEDTQLEAALRASMEDDDVHPSTSHVLIPDTISEPSDSDLETFTDSECEDDTGRSAGVSSKRSPRKRCSNEAVTISPKKSKETCSLNWRDCLGNESGNEYIWALRQ